MKSVKVANKTIGEGYPCFIIAEAGSNHDGKLEQAYQLIDVAKQAGADAVKFQTFSAEKLYSKKTPTMEYVKKNKLLKDGETVWDLIKKVEMPRDWHAKLADYCKKKDIIFLSTPFDLDAVDQLEAVGIPAYKIASYEITHLPLIEACAKTGKPIIQSTGMADLTDIEVALNTIYKAGNRDVVLLHCAINYPAQIQDINLKNMETMRIAFNVPVGFSDHTLGITADIVAVALGAKVIEKHFTLSRKLTGPDHPFAVEPEELAAMVKAIRDTEASFGSAIKKHTPVEEEMYRLARRSLVAARSIPKGTQITRDMIEVKRPGFGIPTRMMEALIGRTAKINIEEDDILTWEMV